MLSRKEYVRSSLENNLFYSRILMEHATIIITLIPNTFLEEINVFTEEQNMYARMNDLLLDLADGKVSQEYIDSKLLVTKFTKEFEEDTMKMFNVDIDLSLTDKSLNLKSGDFKLDAELLRKIDDINKQMITLIAKTIIRVKNISDLHIIKNDFLLLHFVKESFTFNKDIERLISCVGIDPTYVYSQLYYNTDYLKDHSELYSNLISKDNKLFVANALKLFKESSELMKEFDNVISPSSIKNLSSLCTKTAGEFNLYSNQLNDALMINTSVFTYVPILSDHILRENHSFLSVLKLIDKS